MNQEFFKEIRKKLMDNMKEDSALVLFSGRAPQKTADELYSFTPNRNFYYVTGIDKEKIIFMAVKARGTIKEMLFIEPSDPIMEKWIGKRMVKAEAQEASGIEAIHYLDDFRTKFNKAMNDQDICKLYLDLERLEWDWAPTEAQQFAKEAAERYPGLRIRNIYDEIRRLRVKKAAVEVENIKAAIEITGKGIENIMRHAQAGLGENELQAHFDFTLTCSGVKDHAFSPIVASGKNGAVLHYHDNNCTVSDGSLVLLDLGAQYGYYSADISRTFPANGRFTERQAILYNIVLKAQLETMKAIKPGVLYTQLNEVTKKVLINECKQIGLIKEDSEISKYYYHGVTHHLGLDTHDVGDREGALEAGMVLTVEPGLYIEEEGIGIRIEDDVLITENGCENLSPHIIKTVEEIEAFMAKR